MQISFTILNAHITRMSYPASFDFILQSVLQYIPRNMHTVFALLCFVVVVLTIAPVPAMQPWWIWINTSCEFIMNDCITTTKQSTTKPCAYFLGYTVCLETVRNDRDIKPLYPQNCISTPLWVVGVNNICSMNRFFSEVSRYNNKIYIYWNRRFVIWVMDYSWLMIIIIARFYAINRRITLTLLHKNTRSCAENECCYPRTINISNVNFTSKISIPPEPLLKNMGQQMYGPDSSNS